MTATTYTADSDTAHVAAFDASDNTAAMREHMLHDHGWARYGAESSNLSATLLHAAHINTHRINYRVHIRTADHTCTAYPLCEQAASEAYCQHQSCQAAINSQCMPCMDEALDGRGQFDPVMCTTHGWTWITDAGSNSGFAGEGVWWANYACGCGEMESGEVTL